MTGLLWPFSTRASPGGVSLRYRYQWSHTGPTRLITVSGTKVLPKVGNLYQAAQRRFHGLRNRTVSSYTHGIDSNNDIVKSAQAYQTNRAGTVIMISNLPKDSIGTSQGQELVQPMRYTGDVEALF